MTWRYRNDVDQWTKAGLRRRSHHAALDELGSQGLLVTTADGGMHIAATVGARHMHVSSDAVFSGLAGRYDETSPPEPTTPYGAAKAAAATASTKPACLRARTGLPGPLEVRLNCTMTQPRLTTRLRGAREFLVLPVRRPW